MYLTPLGFLLNPFPLRPNRLKPCQIHDMLLFKASFWLTCSEASSRGGKGVSRQRSMGMWSFRAPVSKRPRLEAEAAPPPSRKRAFSKGGRHPPPGIFSSEPACTLAPPPNSKTPIDFYLLVGFPKGDREGEGTPPTHSGEDTAKELAGPNPLL